MEETAMRNDGPVSVRMFGGLSITCSFGAETRTVTDGERAAQKRWVLLEYLILHRGRIIEKEELCAMARTGWQDLKAIKTGNVFQADSDSLTRPGPRLADAAKQLFGFFSPEAQ